MKLELLMSVMHQSDFSLARMSNIEGNLLIINQCDSEGTFEESHYGNFWRMISTEERGLSNSRNMAIDNAVGEVCKLCDDDESLVSGYENIILNAYKELPDADVIIFNLNRINYNMKKSYYRIDAVREAPAHRSYGSPMITFKLTSIKSSNIKFNTEFGSGGRYGGGEDNLFLRDVRKAGLKIYEHPAVISTIDYGRFGSKWFNGYDERYFYNLGVFHQYVSPNKRWLNVLWSLYLAYKLRREKINPFKIVKWRLAGANGYKHGKKTFEEYLRSKQ